MLCERKFQTGFEAESCYESHVAEELQPIGPFYSRKEEGEKKKKI